MYLYKVTLDVDGKTVTETLNSKSGDLAIKYAKKQHPVHVVGVEQLEEQPELPGINGEAVDVHEDQTGVDDFVEYEEPERGASAPPPAVESAGDLEDVDAEDGGE